VSGRKRHLLVDTLGLIWGLAVLPAAPTDWDGAVEVFKRVGQTLPRLARVWADSAYRALADWASKNVKWVLDIVTRRGDAVGFEVQPWRWVVERTFGWFNRYRRLSKDYEHTLESSAAWVYITAIHRMSRFALPERNRDDHLLKRPQQNGKN
jgi:putative transposase